jgi:hypothetical protein
MFTKKNAQPSLLDDAISDVYAEMKGFTCDDEGYVAAIDSLVKLHKIKESEPRYLVSPDVVVSVAANLLGIMMILHHERANVIASKALGFVLKLR